jgi:hypothetical protein
MTPPEPPAALAAALASCGYACVECGSGVVRLDWAPRLGYVPVVTHWPVTVAPPRWRRWLRVLLRRPEPPVQWCPVLSGGPAAKLATLDVLDALAAAVALADYDEPVWHRRDLAAR